MRPIQTGGIIGSILLLAAGQDAVKLPAAGALSPYIQTCENGAYVDWLDGHVGVRGKTIIFKKIAQNKVFYLQTKSAAEKQGHDRMLALLAEVPLDGSTLLGADTDLKSRIGERVMSETSVEVVNDTGSFFEVLLKTPMWGPDSLLQLILGEPGPPRVVPQAVTTAGLPPITATPPGEEPTGLIIDARGLAGTAPAMVPRVLDEAGRLIHGVDSADRTAIRERGLVAYAISPSGADPQVGGIRQGDRPMMVKAVSSSGVTHADIIIRQPDADRIAATASAPAFLKDCRVIVLMNPPPPQKPLPARGMGAVPEKKPKPKPRPADPNLY